MVSPVRELSGQPKLGLIDLDKALAISFALKANKSIINIFLGKVMINLFSLFRP
jgi:hypothetical protein